MWLKVSEATTVDRSDRENRHHEHHLRQRVVPCFFFF